MFREAMDDTARVGHKGGNCILRGASRQLSQHSYLTCGLAFCKAANWRFTSSVDKVMLHDAPVS